MRTLTRIAGPLLAAGALVLGSTALANADTPHYDSYCNGPITIAPNITAKTCVIVRDSTDAYAFVTIQNTSPYVVTLSADLIVGQTTYFGSQVTCAPNSARQGISNTVENPGLPGP